MMKDILKNDQKVVVIGAGSGIGRALTKVFARNGYKLGLVDKQLQLLR